MLGITIMDSRKHMGKDREGVIFPVAPNLSEMSDNYLEFIEEIKKEIQNQVKKVTAPYKYPRIVEFVDELPKTTSGKIRRVEIRQQDEKK